MSNVSDQYHLNVYMSFRLTQYVTRNLAQNYQFYFISIYTQKWKGAMLLSPDNHYGKSAGCARFGNSIQQLGFYFSFVSFVLHPLCRQFFFQGDLSFLFFPLIFSPFRFLGWVWYKCDRYRIGCALWVCLYVSCFIVSQYILHIANCKRYTHTFDVSY